MATGDWNYYCTACRQMYYNAHGCPIHGRQFESASFTTISPQKLEEAEAKLERVRLYAIGLIVGAVDFDDKHLINIANTFLELIGETFEYEGVTYGKEAS